MRIYWYSNASSEVLQENPVYAEVVDFGSFRRVAVDLLVEDSSYRYKAIMSDNNLTLYFSLPRHLEIPVGAYVTFQNETYTLLRPEDLKMKHTRSFEYTVIFESPQANAKKWKFRNTPDGRLKFSLTAKPREHLQMFVDNMNQRDSGWTVGDCIDAEEHLINYDFDFCSDALNKMADEFKTEYEIDRKRVSLGKVERFKDNPYPLSYGKGNGFKSGVGRTSDPEKMPVEILFAQGGERNIDYSKYGSLSLHLPLSGYIRFDGEHFEDEDGFDPDNARSYVSDGFSVRRSDKALKTHAEDSFDGTDYYPKRVGEVSQVVVVDESKNFYDIVDADIPQTCDYNACLIAGETMTVKFQSGMLAGREFDVKYHHTAKGDKAARRFELVPMEEDGITMPSGVFVPQVGDKYIVFNCQLPDAYINDAETKTGAEWDMMRACVRYLYAHEEQEFAFTGELDGIWAKSDWENILGHLQLGAFILFTDEQFQPEGAKVRITGIKNYVNNPHSPEITLSNTPATTGMSATMKTLESQEVLIDSNYQNALQFTKRRFRDSLETIKMLSEAQIEGFNGTIEPVAIQTMALLAGSESLQFRFLTLDEEPVLLVLTEPLDNESKTVHMPACKLQHLTLGIKTLSSSHEASEYKTWPMTEFESASLDDPDKTYYLYAKVKREDTSAAGTFLLSEKSIAMEGVADYYHFLCGIINSEYEGARTYTSLYGFTEILPGRITTERIVSADGDSVLDLLRGAMKLGDSLTYNDDGTKKLKLKFLMSENSNLGGWIFRNNRLESQNGSAWLDGRNGSARLKGVMQFSTASSGSYTDANLFYLPQVNQETDISLATDYTEIGKVIRFYNSGKYGKGVYRIHCIDFEASGEQDGFSWTSTPIDGGYYALVYPQEVVEITCFERTGSGQGTVRGEWVITSRFSVRDFLVQGAKGRYPLVLAMGHVTAGNSPSLSGSWWEGHSITSKLTLTRLETGKYKIAFSTSDVPSGYQVMLSGGAFRSSHYYDSDYEDWLDKYETVSLGLAEKESDHFTVGETVFERMSDSNFDFIIFAPNWWYNLKDI